MRSWIASSSSERAAAAAPGPCAAFIMATPLPLTDLRSDPVRDVLSVPAGAEDQHRAERVLEREPGEVEARGRLDDTALLLGPAVLTGDARLDPGEVLPE